MVVCKICGRKFKVITHTHLKKEHNIDSVEAYVEQTGGEIGQRAKRSKKKVSKPKQERFFVEKEVVEETPKPVIRTIADVLGQRGLKDR